MSGNWVQIKQGIEARIAAGEPQPRGVTELPLAEIEVIEEVFQHRSRNQASSRQHAGALAKSLKKRRGTQFDPVTVFWIGDAWALVDGHHRYEAYQAADKQEPIPVRVFTGTLDEAIGEALRGNSRNKLSMGSREKSEAAWRLVAGTGLRIFQVVEASTRTKPTVIKMFKVRNELLEKDAGIDLGSLTWEQAQRVHKGLGAEESTYDEKWEEKQAKALADRLCKTFGSTLGKQPGVLWRALGIYDSRIQDAFLEMVGIDPEEFNLEEF